MVRSSAVEVNGVALPPLPSYSWNSVWQMVQKLGQDQVLKALRSAPWGEAERQRVVRQLLKHLRSACPQALSESLSPYLGMSWAEATWLRLCWLLAGNLSRLRAGQPVFFWSSQSELEWSPLKVIQVETVRDQVDRWRVVCWSWGGSAAACEFSCLWSRSFCYAVSWRLGFSRRGGRYPFRNPRELYGMLFYGLLDPQQSHPQRPKFTQLAASAGQIRQNRRLMTMRLRTRPLQAGGPVFRCPLQLPPEVPCYHCRCTERNCPAACRG